MRLLLYGILIVLALLIVLIVFNPNISCFGKKLKSPFYPLVRKKKRDQKRNQPVDYGFDLGGTGKKGVQGASAQKRTPLGRPGKGASIATEDYGFDLRGNSKKKQG